MTKTINETETAKFVRPSDLMNFSVPVTVKRIYTTVDGIVVPIALAPAVLQTFYPVPFLGTFDFRGGYRKAFEAKPPDSGTKLICTFVYGISTPQFVTGFSGLNNIQGQMKIGDIVTVYTDDLAAPNGYVWIIQQAANASIASIIENFSSTSKDDLYNRLYVDCINYTTSNDNFDQWSEQITKLNCNNLGLVRSDSFSPLIYRTPFTYQTKILVLGLQFKCDQFFGLVTYMQYATEELQFIFKVRK